MQGGDPERGATAAEPASVELVPIGVVIGAHGLRGELRVKLYNPASEVLAEREHMTLRVAGQPPSRVALQSAREHAHGMWLVTLAQSRDRDAALRLRGAELCLARSELPALAEGEHYLLDLAGLEARTADGTVVGRVLEALEYPASHVLRVQSDRGELEVPLAEPYVLDLRPGEGYVIVAELEDLEPIAARKPHRS